MWVLPTGHNDPGSDWTNEANAYDGDTETYAAGAQGGDFLELTHKAVNCRKVRLWIEREGPSSDVEFDIDLYYNSQWNHLFDGTKDLLPDFPSLYEFEIGSEEIVSVARIKNNEAIRDISVFGLEFEARKGFVG